MNSPGRSTTESDSDEDVEDAHLEWERAVNARFRAMTGWESGPII
jgi:hypothetical protein